MTDAPSPTRRFFGALLMAIGGLMAVLCGGCGATFIVVALVTMFTATAQDAPMLAGMGLVIGGVPAAMGVGLFWVGRRMRGEAPRPTAKSIWPPPGEDAP